MRRTVNAEFDRGSLWTRNLSTLGEITLLRRPHGNVESARLKYSSRWSKFHVRHDPVEFAQREQTQS